MFHFQFRFKVKRNIESWDGVSYGLIEASDRPLYFTSGSLLGWHVLCQLSWVEFRQNYIIFQSVKNCQFNFLGKFHFKLPNFSRQNCPKQRIKNRHFSLLCCHAFKVSPGKIQLLECLPSCSSQLFVTFRNSTFKIMKIHATFVRSTLSGPSVRHSAAGQNASCMFLILANLSLLKIIRAEHRAACSAPSWVAVESTAERRSKARAPFKNARDC